MNAPPPMCDGGDKAVCPLQASPAWGRNQVARRLPGLAAIVFVPLWQASVYRVERLGENYWGEQ